MHKVIIPIDFSPTALNAARFVAKMVAGQKDTQIILYHQYFQEADLKINQPYLLALQQELLQKGDASVELEIEQGGDLIKNLDRLAHTRRATLIAMGLTGRSDMRQKFIGSNTLKMVDSSIYPVMIIPPDAIFNKIINIAFACDFKDVENSTPTHFINAVLELFDAKLHIVNVNPSFYIALDESALIEQEKLQNMFSNHQKEFHFLVMNDFHDAIHRFLADKNIDMLITIPRHHAGNRGLWANSNTRKLAYHQNIPILTAHP